MIKKKLLNIITKLNLDNPLEFIRELIAPLCKEKLNEHIMNCHDCSTCKNCEKQIAKGNPNANYLIINDNATDDEDINNYLYSILEAAEIPLDDIFIINSISCILKRTFGDETIIRLPNRIEANNCKYFVDYALKFVNPRVIICMGATSLAMYRNDITIEDVKGQFININGYKTLVTNSAKDMFMLADTNTYTEDELTDIANNVALDVNKAKQYIDSISRGKTDNE